MLHYAAQVRLVCESLQNGVEQLNSSDLPAVRADLPSNLWSKCVSPAPSTAHASDAFGLGCGRRHAFRGITAYNVFVVHLVSLCDVVTRFALRSYCADPVLASVRHEGALLRSFVSTLTCRRLRQQLVSISSSVEAPADTILRSLVETWHASLAYSPDMLHAVRSSAPLDTSRLAADASRPFTAIEDALFGRLDTGAEPREAIPVEWTAMKIAQIFVEDFSPKDKTLRGRWLQLMCSLAADPWVQKTLQSAEQLLVRPRAIVRAPFLVGVLRPITRYARRLIRSPPNSRQCA
jgi:hypothetical protein